MSVIRDPARELRRAILALRHGYYQSGFSYRRGDEHPQKAATKKALALLDELVADLEQTEREWLAATWVKS